MNENSRMEVSTYTSEDSKGAGGWWTWLRLDGVHVAEVVGDTKEESRAMAEAIAARWNAAADALNVLARTPGQSADRARGILRTAMESRP